MKKQFLVITQTAQEKELCAWWERLMKYTFDTQLFESFDEARKFMRHKISEEVDGSESLFDQIFYYDDDDLEEADEDALTDDPTSTGGNKAKKIRILTEALVSNADYFPEKIEKIKYTDDDDHEYAYTCDEKTVIASCNGLRLEYNIHKMDHEDFYYYFDVFEDGKNQTHCLFSIKLINTEKTIESSESISDFSSDEFYGRDL